MDHHLIDVTLSTLICFDLSHAWIHSGTNCLAAAGPHWTCPAAFISHQDPTCSHKPLGTMHLLLDSSQQKPQNHLKRDLLYHTCLLHDRLNTVFFFKVKFILLCSIMYNSPSSFMYCKAFQSFKEDGSACVFSKHDLFVQPPCVCLVSESAYAFLSIDSPHCGIKTIYNDLYI